jgi:hypothetical protein
MAQSGQRAGVFVAASFPPAVERDLPHNPAIEGTLLMRASANNLICLEHARSVLSVIGASRFSWANSLNRRCPSCDTQVRDGRQPGWPKLPHRIDEERKMREHLWPALAWAVFWTAYMRLTPAEWQAPTHIVAIVALAGFAGFLGYAFQQRFGRPR